MVHPQSNERRLQWCLSMCVVMYELQANRSMAGILASPLGRSLSLAACAQEHPWGGWAGASPHHSNKNEFCNTVENKSVASHTNATPHSQVDWMLH